MSSHLRYSMYDTAKALLSPPSLLCPLSSNERGGEWPSGLYSLRQVTEVKLGRVRSDFGWVTTEA